MAGEFEEALTLVQYSQRLEEGSAERAVVETFVGESDIMAAMVIRPAKKRSCRTSSSVRTTSPATPARGAPPCRRKASS
jgi:hypothetical protein